MKIIELPSGTIAIKWNNANRKDEDICVECSVLRDKIFRVDSDEFEKLVPPPLHGDCECYLTFIDSSGEEIRGE